ncbi:sugar ABC transporter ATP-binding protein [Capillimicrobium parvum]|nr:sugar ABC transporter ATP-binding protein [Capillimicrobium parvum]
MEGLRASGVSKSFHGNRVLHNLDLEISAGQVRALLGHNGSGKSTFIKILAGYYEPDDGSGPITVGGKTLVPGDPDSTFDAGVTFVHQTLGLVGQLSVLENMRLGMPWRTTRLGAIVWSKERAAVREALAAFDLHVHPDAEVGQLSTVEQTEIAIVRAVSVRDDIRVLVLDEPTAALTEHEVQKLFALIARVQARGVAILYVTHRLDEIAQIADAVTVLSDGETVGQGPVAEFPERRLVELIAGASVSVQQPRAAADAVAGSSAVPDQDEAPRMTVAGLKAGELVDARFDGHGGEILGAVGLLGSGIIDLSRALTGRLRPETGDVTINGKRARLGDMAAMVHQGYGAVVGARSDRVLMDMTVRENITLATVRNYFRGGFLRSRAEKAAAASAISHYDVRCAGPEVETGTLSGGNQQKVAIGKVLQAGPSVIVLEEPFNGVDARGRAEIADMLRAAAAGGALVLLIDSDLDEVAGICSRVLVLRDGRVMEEFRGSGIVRSRLLDACYG